jgi:ectoine hydroxylase-related dioxygenase (phytanoyl-CoA dioxygenase family)
MFESLWIDRPEADGILAELLSHPDTMEVGSHLKDFHENGYCIIRNAVDRSVIDDYLREFAALIDAGKLSISHGLEIRSARRGDLQEPLTKVLDTFVYSEAARKIAFAPPLLAFLSHLFGEPPLAFQNLHFEVGSTQAVHNDTAYVVVNEPKSLAASWVALEDIQPGTGELIYYPGSHRFGEFLYQQHRKNWVVDEDGHEIHDHHLHWLHERAEELGVSLERFSPKKGDALFWHADLAHGGGTIDHPGSTRRSLVTHYCPARCTPHYFRFIDVDRQVKRRTPNGGYLSSFYYEL